MKQFLGGTSSPATSSYEPMATSLPVTAVSSPVAQAAPASAVAEQISGGPVEKPAVPVAEATVPTRVAAPAAQGGNVDREGLTTDLVNLVSERTGYPADMLGLEQDVEADLGIDSIKRVEIFGAFQNQLPPALVAKLSEHTEDLTRIRTLKGWIDAVMDSTS